MSAFIDYSRRLRGQQNDHSDEDHSQQNPFGDERGARPDSDIEAAQQPHPAQGRGHHFDVEHIETTGDTQRPPRQQDEQNEFFDPTFHNYTDEEPLENKTCETAETLATYRSWCDHESVVETYGAQRTAQCIVWLVETWLDHVQECEDQDVPLHNTFLQGLIGALSNVKEVEREIREHEEEIERLSGEVHMRDGPDDESGDENGEGDRDGDLKGEPMEE